ncbi:MAG: PHP domain-containing protein, partial [Gammaproteobacteria bacterium]|nr:PHP domain-containing protein [Gammaproteobacteria bacterium]
MLYDLHCHSTASDGSLSPTELVQLAVAKNIDYLSITDHDTVEGLQEAGNAAKGHNIKLINGIEFSVSWYNKTIHIVGLNIEPDNQQLIDGINKLQNYRLYRAQEISKDLQ